MARGGSDSNFNLFDAAGCKRQNLKFILTFDFYTPRAHLILLQSKKSNIVFDKKFMTYLLEASEAAVMLFGLRAGPTGTNYPPILSLHRGSWFRGEFHAHVCVDTGEYLTVFDNYRSKIPGWPSKKFVTGQWKASRDPNTYADNVRRYPYVSYHADDVREIQAKFDKGAWNEGVATFESYRLVFHQTTARVGFKPSGVTNRAEVMSAMERFCKENKMTEKGKNSYYGGQICQSLGSDFTGFPEPVPGYIQMSGARFIDLCPSNLRKEWFDRYKRADTPTMT